MTLPLVNGPLDCKVYSIASMGTLTWEGIEFGNFILIAAIHYSAH